MKEIALTGHIIDLEKKEIFPGSIKIKEGRIAEVIRSEGVDPSAPYILPGFIDAHIHIESSMLVPSEFARIAVTHGTVATVSDPHEIANVLGLPGINYMINNGKQVPFHFFFGAPSCVPATTFETSGATITGQEIHHLFKHEKLHYLSEMMNFPGVLTHDRDVMEKIQLAKRAGKPIDGHAPGLRGAEAARYIREGISSDHECFTLEEALEKIKYGMKILIREGSAAKNFGALHPLLKSHPHQVMFCSDDKHPNELVEGHIDQLVKRAVAEGYPVFDVLRAACLYPIKHYHLDVGLLRVGDSADCIVVNNLKDFKVKETYIRGQLVARDGKSLIARVPVDQLNHFHAKKKTEKDFALEPQSKKIHVIEAIDGQLVTNKLILPAKVEENNLVSDIAEDVLKIVVVNRYKEAPPAVGFVRGFGLKEGALASCIAHDSHNIIAVGVDDKAICQAVNGIIEAQGGICVVKGGKVTVLPLPVAGILSPDDGYQVAKKYAEIDALAKQLGTKLSAPFMTLSFMALLVIPSLKLSDKGLFDGTKFAFIPVSA